jgi:hypothetical protein
MADQAAKEKDESEKRSEEFKKMMDNATTESGRGFVTTSAAVIDVYLERVIKAFLIDGQEVRELFEGAYAPFGDMFALAPADFAQPSDATCRPTRSALRDHSRRWQFRPDFLRQTFGRH